jgi:hypothetical protein
LVSFTFAGLKANGKRMNVLILGAANDPHVLSVKAALEHEGATVSIFDPRSAACKLRVAISNSDTRVEITNSDGHSVLLRSFTAGWNRLKLFRLVEWTDPLHKVMDDFAHDEWLSATRSLSAFTSDMTWVNSNDAVARIASKPAQLFLAAKCGLLIPETRITNDSVFACGLQAPEMIFKTLTPARQSNQVVFTDTVARDTLLANQEEIGYAPGIFQERIARDHDLRVAVVGSTVLVVRLDTQSSETTALDWRRDQLAPIHHIGQLSVPTTTRLLDFHNRAGLAIAQYDFLVRDCQEIFLECNPGGQWLWLEERVPEFSVSSCLARLLLRK